MKRIAILRTAMIRVLALAAAVLALGTAAPAFARADSTYYIVGLDEEALTLVDLTSLKDTGGTRQVWSAIIYAKPTAVFTTLGPVTYMRAFNEFDCAAKKYRLIGMRAEDAGSATIFSDDSVMDWQAVAPNTLAETMYGVACNKTKLDDDGKFTAPLSRLRETYLAMLAKK